MFEGSDIRSAEQTAYPEAAEQFEEPADLGVAPNEGAPARSPFCGVGRASAGVKCQMPRTGFGEA